MKQSQDIKWLKVYLPNESNYIYLSDLCYFWQGDIEVCYETEIT